MLAIPPHNSALGSEDITEYEGVEIHRGRSRIAHIPAGI